MAGQMIPKLTVEAVGMHPDVVVVDADRPELALQEGERIARPYDPIAPETPDSMRWQVFVNGEPVEGPVGSVELVNPNFGRVRYTKDAKGAWGVPTFLENGGGGAVTLPVMQDSKTGSWHVGLVLEERPNMGGMVWNVPRGFIKQGESHKEGAAREAEEETGVKREALISRLFTLATGVNPNSAFFDTSQSPDDGVAFFAFPMEQTELEPTVFFPGTDEPPYVIHSFPAHVREAFDKGDRDAQRILGSKIVPLEVAFKSRDMFTKAIVGQFLMALQLGEFRREVLETGNPLWLPAATE